MLTIALTGGIACGKSTVAEMLQSFGASVIDADAISRGLTAPGGAALPMIRQTFGGDVFHADGTLDRKALSQKVFGNEAALAKLNGITHPMILAEMEAQKEACRKQGAEAVVLDVPLLFEANMQHLGDFIVCVTAPEEVQIQRMASRNGFTREEALSRIQSQMPVWEKARRSDVVIDTDRPIDELEQEVRRLYQGWITSARKEHP